VQGGMALSDQQPGAIGSYVKPHLPQWLAEIARERRAGDGGLGGGSVCARVPAGASLPLFPFRSSSVPLAEVAVF